MKRCKGGYTLRQFNYARGIVGATKSKKEVALNAGYSKFVASCPQEKIENTEGFNNAMVVIAAEAGNLVLAVMHEYKARGLKNFSNSELNSAMNAISNAYSKFNKNPDGGDNEKANKLRGILTVYDKKKIIDA